jgi:hypothetical protein
MFGDYFLELSRNAAELGQLPPRRASIVKQLLTEALGIGRGRPIPGREPRENPFVKERNEQVDQLWRAVCLVGRQDGARCPHTISDISRRKLSKTLPMNA